jgi:hypothetical protein
MARWRLNPVFFESSIAARRWQTFAGRTAFIACLFAGLVVVWIEKVPDELPPDRNQLAAIGEAFFAGIAGILESLHRCSQASRPVCYDLLYPPVVSLPGSRFSTPPTTAR